jgi:hypothetical protein
MAALSAIKLANPVNAVDSYSRAASPYTVDLIPLAEGAAGTCQSLEAMARAVRGEIAPDFSGWQDSFNQRAASRLCAGYLGGDLNREIAALFDFCAHSLTYVPHPMNCQIVQDCRRTIEIGSGDCVSLSVCLATLLACRGRKSIFVAQFVDGEEASHVYVECSGLALDPVASDQPMGWRQPLEDGGFELPYEIFK